MCFCVDHVRAIVHIFSMHLRVISSTKKSQKKIFGCQKTENFSLFFEIFWSFLDFFGFFQLFLHFFKTKQKNKQSKKKMSRFFGFFWYEEMTLKSAVGVEKNLVLVYYFFIFF